MPRSTLRVLMVSVLVVLGLCAAPLAEARRISVDVTCAQAFSPEQGAEAGVLLFWVPGWWAAMHDDPYINDWRRSLLTEAIVNACRANANTRILDVVRQVNTLPAVPDNALEMGCADFLTSVAGWQIMTVYWMQGYYAYMDGHTDLETEYLVAFDKIEAQCTKNPAATVGKVARDVLK